MLFRILLSLVVIIAGAAIVSFVQKFVLDVKFESMRDQFVYAITCMLYGIAIFIAIAGF